MKLRLLVALLIIWSCDKTNEETADTLSTVSFSYSQVPFVNAHGAAVPICSEREPVYVHLKFRNAEVHGFHKKKLDEDFIMDPGKYWLQEFDVLTKDGQSLYQLPRAYQGRAFVFHVEEGKSVKISVPVHCIP